MSFWGNAGTAAISRRAGTPHRWRRPERTAAARHTSTPTKSLLAPVAAFDITRASLAPLRVLFHFVSTSAVGGRPMPRRRPTGVRSNGDGRILVDARQRPRDVFERAALR